MRFVSVALAGLCTLSFSISALAGAVLNVPASEAKVVDAGSSNCAFDRGFFSPTPQPEYCVLDFPITVPAGTTIKQATVIYGMGNGNPAISADLISMGNTSWGDQAYLFNWFSYAPLQNTNELARGNLMAQFGKNYPDAFSVATDKMYILEVHLVDGAYVTGVQVTYE